MRTAFVALADLVLPRVCTVCGTRLLPSEHCVCTVCLSDVPYTHFESVSHNPMADRFNAAIDQKAGRRYEYAAALFYYTGADGYSLITRSLKYNGNLESGRFFGRLLGERIASSALFADATVIVPVPLHWTRRWKRGYNQAEVIAASVASASASCGLALYVDGKSLKRIRRTKTQTRLAVADKKANVCRAFAVHRASAALRGASHVILLDDVFTTGSTLAACYEALRSVLGEKVRISVITLGFVGHQ